MHINSRERYMKYHPIYMEIMISMGIYWINTGLLSILSAMSILLHAVHGAI